MKTSKIDFFSIGVNGEHWYEFSSNVVLDKVKPMTKLIIRKVHELGLPLNNVKSHKRNYVTFEYPINKHNNVGAKIFKRKDVVKFYCIKSKDS